MAHCPSSTLILASGISPVVSLRAAGVRVGLGVDGSASADAASLWLEARQAMLLARLRDGAQAGTARMALEVTTRGGAGCLGREGELGELSPGAVGDVAVWKLDGPVFAGAIADPIEAWLRCGPTAAWCTVVRGRRVVDQGASCIRRCRRCWPTTLGTRAASSGCEAGSGLISGGCSSGSRQTTPRCSPSKSGLLKQPGQALRPHMSSSRQ